MTVPDAVEVLLEFRKLTLGPELSEAIDVIAAYFNQQAVLPVRGDAQ